MTVVSAYRYDGGERCEDIALDDPPELAPGGADFVWIGLADPTEEELGAVARGFGLHPLAVEDAARKHLLPKVDVYGDQIFIVARTARFENDLIIYGETAVFLGERYIVTIRRGSARGHADLRKQLEAAPKLLGHGAGYVLQAVLDFIVDGYQPVVATIEENVLKTEQRALSGFLDRGEIRRIFSFRRQLIRFQRILGPMAEVCGKLMRLDIPTLAEDAKPYFGQVQDHIRRVDAVVMTLRDALSSVVEVSYLFEQQRQGVITRQLAAWAAILAVPTAIAGIYGMNFQNMPELKWRYGYFVTLGVIFLICGLLYARFKKAGWL